MGVFFSTWGYSIHRISQRLGWDRAIRIGLADEAHTSTDRQQKSPRNPISLHILLIEQWAGKRCQSPRSPGMPTGGCLKIWSSPGAGRGSSLALVFQQGVRFRDSPGEPSVSARRIRQPGCWSEGIYDVRVYLQYAQRGCEKCLSKKILKEYGRAGSPIRVIWTQASRISLILDSLAIPYPRSTGLGSAREQGRVELPAPLLSPNSDGAGSLRQLVVHSPRRKGAAGRFARKEFEKISPPNRARDNIVNMVDSCWRRNLAEKIPGALLAPARPRVGWNVTLFGLGAANSPGVTLTGIAPGGVEWRPDSDGEQAKEGGGITSKTTRSIGNRGAGNTGDVDDARVLFFRRRQRQPTSTAKCLRLRCGVSSIT